MITATINGVALDLPRDFQIDLTSQSQILSFDKLSGDVVPSVSFPDTENNRNLLRHPNRFETKRTGLTEFSNFELRADGYLLIAGKLVLDNGFTGYIAGATGVLAASQEDKLVTDYPLPTNQVFDNKTSYSPETDDYCAPAIVNPDFFKDLGRSREIPIGSQIVELTYLQYQHRNIQNLINARQDGLVFFSTDTIRNLWGVYGQKLTVTSPFLYYFNAVKQLMKINGFYELFNDFSTHDFMSLCVYNNFSVNDIAPTLLINDPEKWESISNGYETFVSRVSQYSQFQRNFNFTNLLPRISLKEFLLMPQNMLNFATVFSGNRYAILDREGVMASEPVDIDAYFMGEWTLKGKENNLVKFSVATDANDYYFGTYYQDLDEREADFIADVNTATEMQAITPAVGALCRVLQEQRIYEYNTHVITAEDGSEVESIGWHFVSIDFQPLKYNKNATNTDTIEINAAGTLPFSGAGQVRQPGKVSLRKDTEADFSLRLLFDDANVGKNNKGDYTLNFRYTNNLIERRWSRTARFLANREEVEGYFRFPAILLSQIASDLRSPRNLNRTRFRTRHGVFIISKMVTRVNHSGILESKVTAYKV